MSNVTFSGIQKLIIVNSGVTTLDIQVDVYSDWKEWEQISDNSKFVQALRPVGGDPLTATKDLGDTYFIMNGWKIRPAEFNHRLQVEGNLFTEDESSPFVQTLGNYNVVIESFVSNLTDATLAQISEIEQSAFLNRVQYDPIAGSAGTAYPQGTPKAPVNNLTDAKIIAVDRGFTEIHTHENLVIESTEDISDLKITGMSQVNSLLDIKKGALTNDTYFFQVSISGTLTGSTTFDHCTTRDIDNFSGQMQHCLIAGTETVTLSGIATAFFIDCWSAVPGMSTPVIDLGGSGCSLVLRHYSGGIELINKFGPESVSVDLSSGQVVLSNTITNGTFVIRGVGKLTDNSVGATIEDYLISPTSIWSKTASDFIQPGTFGQIISKPYITCQTGTLTTINFTTDSTKPTGFWTSKLFIQFTGNVTAALANKTCKLSAYINAGGQFTVEDSLPVAPADGDTFYVINN